MAASWFSYLNYYVNSDIMAMQFIKMMMKALNVIYDQHHADYPMHTLKKTGDIFERISWGQAIDKARL